MDKNDSPPTFRDLPQSYMVSEDLGTGQLVATIKASDPDTIGKLEYSLVSGDDGKFLLEKYQGTLKLRDTLDRETKDLYKLLIRVTDGVQYTETTIAVQVCSTLIRFEFIDRIAALCKAGEFPLTRKWLLISFEKHFAPTKLSVDKHFSCLP